MKKINIYLLINIIFLLPSLVSQLALAYLPRIYGIMLVSYWHYEITKVHLVLIGIFAIWQIVVFAKKKDKRTLVTFLCLAFVSTFLNIFWMMDAWWLARQ